MKTWAFKAPEVFSSELLIVQVQYAILMLKQAIVSMKVLMACQALDYCTGAQAEFWGPGVLPPPGFFIVLYSALLECPRHPRWDYTYPRNRCS